MTPGRKPHPHGRVRWEISLPGDLAARIELECLDELTGRTAYGKRSELVVKLLTKYLEQTYGPLNPSP